MRLARLAGALGVVAAVALPGAGASAQAFDERIVRYDVTLDVRPTGVLHVTEAIDYDFGAQYRHGIFRTIPRRFHYDDRYDRVYPVHDVRVSGAPGTPLDFSTSTSGGDTVVKIGDPDRTVTGRHRYVIAYDVDGALNQFDDDQELYWNAIGTEWGVPMDAATVTVRAAAPIGDVACFAGPDGSTRKCRSSRVRGGVATFEEPALRPYYAFTVVAALPVRYAPSAAPLLVERWSLDRAFERSPRALALSGLVLLAGVGTAGGLVYAGRDRRYTGQVPGLEPALGQDADEERVPLGGSRAGPVEFRPPDGMRPALMGLVLDESVDPVDVTATVVDLAVRGYLTIEELPREGRFHPRDWRLRRLDTPTEDPDDRLLPWEERVLSGLFRTGDVALLSDADTHFRPYLEAFQTALYSDGLRLGWFTRHPGRVRGRWQRVGVLLTVAGALLTGLLVPWTHLALVGVTLLLAGVAFLVLHGRMPARTARGSAALARALGFRRYLVTAEAEQLRSEERAGLFARYLPYAIVLGETKHWAKVFHDLGTPAEENLYWYSGPAGWSPLDFTESLGAFTTTTAGTVVSRPPTVSSSGGSGFSGGGSSGGGGGGGGGGSW